MGPTVDLQLPDGRTVSLVEGDFIGRSWRAGVRLDDPRVSEAHALLSLRGDDLVLLGLRGPLVVDGQRADRVPLRPGLRVFLAPDLCIEVLDVVLPALGAFLETSDDQVIAVRGAMGLSAGPQLRVVHPTHPDAKAWIWPADDGWQGRDDAGTRRLDPSAPFTLAGHTLRLCERPLRGSAPTQASHTSKPTRIVVRYESVHLFRGKRPAVVLAGVQARLVSELAAFDAPVPWEMLARSIWPDDAEPRRLRKRLDGALGRLRASLREGGQRSDLVRPLGNGQIELFRYPDDTVVDEQ